MTRKRPDKLLGVYGKILEANGSKQLNSEEPKKKKNNNNDNNDNNKIVIRYPSTPRLIKISLTELEL